MAGLGAWGGVCDDPTEEVHAGISENTHKTGLMIHPLLYMVRQGAGREGKGKTRTEPWRDSLHSMNYANSGSIAELDIVPLSLPCRYRLVTATGDWELLPR